MTLAPSRRLPASTRQAVHGAAWVLGAGAVLTQISFPLTGGGTTALTVLAVLLFAGASIAHAGAVRGPGAALALVVVAGGGGLVAEAVGVATGWPFGEYAYTESLGARVLGVPLLIPAAWVMMAYPALLVARRLVGAHGRAAVAPVAAVALASWDVFLDPQMVAAGHWVWRHPAPSLPGVEGIPVSNFAGWLLVALVLGAVLDRALPDLAVVDELHGRAPRRSLSDRLPFVLYLWTYTSSVMAAAVFFGRPSVALVGGVLMGVVAVPLMVGLRRHGVRR